MNPEVWIKVSVGEVKFTRQEEKDSRNTERNKESLEQMKRRMEETKLKLTFFDKQGLGLTGCAAYFGDDVRVGDWRKKGGKGKTVAMTSSEPALPIQSTERCTIRAHIVAGKKRVTSLAIYLQLTILEV